MDMQRPGSNVAFEHDLDMNLGEVHMRRHQYRAQKTTWFEGLFQKDSRTSRGCCLGGRRCQKPVLVVKNHTYLEQPVYTRKRLAPTVLLSLLIKKGPQCFEGSVNSTP